MANLFFSDEELRRLRQDTSRPAQSRYNWRWFAEQNKPIYLFGCGGFAFGVLSNLQGLNVRGFLDNDPNKQGANFYGLEVFTPAAVAERILQENALVVLSIFRESHVREVLQQCLDWGWNCIDWGQCWTAFEKPVPFELTNTPEAAACYSMWKHESDTKSASIYRDLIRLRTTLDIADAPSVTTPQYFIPEIPHGAVRHFVDAGAYIGDTLDEFLRLFAQDYDAYYAFEPMPDSLARLKTMAAGNQKVRVFGMGVSDVTGMARLSECDTSSRLGAEDGVEVAVTRLDDALKNELVDFIKMDIEGEEPAALRGAVEVIRKNRPVLAISVYHKPEHLWEIPLWIQNLGMGYRLLLRHHSRFLTETVCYALPPA